MDINKFINEFLVHFKNNEEKYKSNNYIQSRKNIPNDNMVSSKDDKDIEKSSHQYSIEDSHKEYTQVVHILNELNNIYNNLTNTGNTIDGDQQIERNKEDQNDSIHLANMTNNPNNILLAYDTRDVIQQDYQTHNAIIYNNKQDIEEYTSKDKMSKSSTSNIDSYDTTHRGNDQNNNIEKKMNNISNGSDYTNSSRTFKINPMDEKDIENINQIMKKNNYINIFTKNNYLCPDDFEYYNTLYILKNQIYQYSIHLLFNYKKYKTNKIKADNSLLYTMKQETEQNIYEDMERINNRYIFSYLYNFFDTFEMFKKNFLDINNIRNDDNNILLYNTVDKYKRNDKLTNNNNSIIKETSNNSVDVSCTGMEKK